MSHFCQSLNVLIVSDARQTEVQTVSVEIQMVVDKLIRYKLPGTNQIRTEDKHYSLRYMNIMLFRIRKNHLISEGAVSFSRRAVLLGDT
jgi:hypothetical protein